MVKLLRYDQLDVSPLKEGTVLHSDPKMKADILNRQFTSVFTYKGEEPVLNLDERIVPDMQPISIPCAGVNKLLKNLKAHTATGPDGIPATAEKGCC